MDPEERKLNQRIAKRKEKVEKMIAELEIIIKDMDPDTYNNYNDYLKSLSSATQKLNRLEQELVILESGHLAQDV